jgi:hypothetical protein
MFLSMHEAAFSVLTVLGTFLKLTVGVSLNTSSTLNPIKFAQTVSVTSFIFHFERPSPALPL